MKFSIVNARVIDPGSGRDEIATVQIADGRIAAIGQSATATTPTIDGTDHWLLPAAVDLGLDMRRLSFADLGQELTAAAAGGCAWQLLEGSPRVLDSAAFVRDLRKRNADDSEAGLCVAGAVTQNLDHQALATMGALRDAGCPVVSDGGVPIADSNLLVRLLQYAHSLELPVLLTPVDPAQATGCVHAGRVSTRLGLSGIPHAAETTAVARIIEAVRVTGARVHLCRLSTAEAIDLLARAREQELPITADVAIHQLLLTENDIGQFDARYHVLPPLRTVTDRDALLAGVAAGVIDVICSHHTPLPRDSRLAPFAVTDPGIAGAQTLVALTLGLVAEGRLPLAQAIGAISSNPARILGLDVGALEDNAEASMMLVRPGVDGPVNDWLSRGRNSPFLDWGLQFAVAHTWRAGQQLH